ncbi:MAG: hypothetical protein NXY57DRAFT_1004362 [Lentinula lateritia]|nr:MAG: hypothetical protein NXY57DRAFT_1004362 [Lentinula lateritia]
MREPGYHAKAPTYTHLYNSCNSVFSVSFTFFCTFFVFISFRTFFLISTTPIQPPISVSQSSYCSRNGTNHDSGFSNSPWFAWVVVGLTTTVCASPIPVPAYVTALPNEARYWCERCVERIGNDD